MAECADHALWKRQDPGASAMAVVVAPGGGKGKDHDYPSWSACGTARAETAS